MNKTYVLDSFAVLALLGRESGGEKVRQLFQRAKEGEIRLLMSWVNIGEVAYIVERRWGRDRVYQVIGTLEATMVEFIVAGRELALQAAEIKVGHTLAYADAFAAAVAVNQGGILVTGDPEFGQLEDILTLQWLPA